MSVEHKRTTTNLELTVDWAPAYELLVSFLVYVNRAKHTLVEVGQTWVDDVRFRLPSDYTQRIAHQAHTLKTRHDEQDLLALLVKVCPAKGRDAQTWLDWLAELAPGAAYEALTPLVPQSGPFLPRDFAAWRDRLVGLLRTWHTYYFSEVDPAILDGLRCDAERVSARVGSLPPQQLVEQVTNGMWVEPGPGTWQVVLVPQYHMRPYNHDCSLNDGILLLYPADVVPTPEDAPPTALLRLTRGLSDESRLRILRYVALGPRSLTEVARFAGLSQPTVHHHLAQLRTAGLLRVHCSLAGPVRYYSLRSHALDQLARQLGTYLEPANTQPED
jgi:DNA-binding transcriptional ArsR family regulator